MKHTGTLLLETERLVLRRFTKEDILPVFNNWSGNPEVTKYLLWSYHKTEKETARFLKKYIRQYYKKDFYVWAVERKEDGEVIGTVDATVFKSKAEIGYCFGEKFWKKGYAFESLSKMIEFFKEIGCDCFGATCAVENKASAKLLMRLGFVKENSDTVSYVGENGFIKCEEYELRC